MRSIESFRDTAYTRPFLARTGMTAVNDASSTDDKVRAGRPFVQAIAAGVGDPQGRAVAEAAMRASGNASAQNGSIQAALQVSLREDIARTTADALVDAAQASTSTPYYGSDKMEATRCFITAIPQYGPVDCETSEHLARTGLSIMDRGGDTAQRVGSGHRVADSLQATRHNPYEQVARVAVRSGGGDAARNGVITGALQTITGGPRSSSANELLARSAENAVNIPYYGADKVKAGTQFAEGVQDPVTDSEAAVLARAGLRVVASGADTSEHAAAGYAFVRSLASHAMNGAYAGLAAAALHVSGGAASQNGAYQAVLDVLTRQPSGSQPELMALAAEHAVTVPYYSSDKVLAALPFAQQIGGSLSEREVARVAQAGLRVIQSGSDTNEKASAGRAFVQALASHACNSSYAYVADAALHVSGGAASQNGAYQAALTLLSREPQAPLPVLLTQAAQLAESVPYYQSDKTLAQNAFLRAMTNAF